MRLELITHSRDLGSYPQAIPFCHFDKSVALPIAPYQHILGSLFFNCYNLKDCYCKISKLLCEPNFYLFLMYILYKKFFQKSNAAAGLKALERKLTRALRLRSRRKKNFALKSNPTYFVRANPPEQVAAHYHILYLSLLASIQLLLQTAYHRFSFHSIRSFYLKLIFSLFIAYHRIGIYALLRLIIRFQQFNNNIVASYYQ